MASRALTHTLTNPKLLPWAAVIAGGLMLTVANLVWVSLETRPPHWDMARHLWNSLAYWDVARHRPEALFEAYYYYPPLIYLVALPFYMLFGTSVMTAVAANNVFLLAGIVAVYGIGRRVGRNPAAGLLAALVFATSPLVASQFKEFQVDGPLTALTAMALWALVASPDFRRRGVAMGLGIVMGLAMLGKWTFPGVIALPLAYAVMLAVWRSWRDRDVQRLINIVLAVVITAAIAYTWYWSHRHQLKLDILYNNAGAAAREGDPVGLSPAALLYYAHNLVNVQAYAVPTLLMLVGLWRVFRRQRWWQDHRMNLVLLLFVGTYGFFTAVSNKDARYTLPMLVAVAVLAAFWLPNLPRRWRRWAYGGVAAYALLTYWAMSFSIAGLPKEVGVGTGTGRLIVWAQRGYIINQPSGENWYLEETMRAASGHTLAYEGPDTVWFNSWAIMYYASRYGVPGPMTGDEPAYWLVRGTEAGTERAGYAIISQHTLPDHTHLTLYKMNLKVAP